MHKACLFCRLTSGELPSHQAYADDQVVVILSRQPVNQGHAMVVTRQHVESFYDAEDELYIHLMLIVKRTALAIKAVYTPLQVVMETSGIGNRHIHVHLIPVHGPYDLVPREVMAREEARPPVPDEQLARVAGDLARSLAGAHLT
jgi:histidine triad (HIT) family protein